MNNELIMLIGGPLDGIRLRVDTDQHILTLNVRSLYLPEPGGLLHPSGNQKRVYVRANSSTIMSQNPGHFVYAGKEILKKVYPKDKDGLEIH